MIRSCKFTNDMLKGCSDFRGVWNSVAINHNDIGRENFMFARQAMNLLEFVSRLCESDPTKHYKKTSNELSKIERKYRTAIVMRIQQGFVLPYRGNSRENLLLWSIFDLVRHDVIYAAEALTDSEGALGGDAYPNVMSPR